MTVNKDVWLRLRMVAEFCRMGCDKFELGHFNDYANVFGHDSGDSQRFMCWTAVDRSCRFEARGGYRNVIHFGTMPPT